MMKENTNIYSLKTKIRNINFANSAKRQNPSTANPTAKAQNKRSIKPERFKLKVKKMMISMVWNSTYS
jgi:hypothetical protein